MCIIDLLLCVQSRSIVPPSEKESGGQDGAEGRVEWEWLGSPSDKRQAAGPVNVRVFS